MNRISLRDWIGFGIVVLLLARFPGEALLRADEKKKEPTAAPNALKLPQTVVLPAALPYRPWNGLLEVTGIGTANSPVQAIVATGLSGSVVMPDDVARLQVD